MATKPTKRILDWASGGTVTDPGASVEATGWEISDRPPAYWWNWILQSFGDWLTYLEFLTGAGYQIHSALDSGMRKDCSSQSTTVRSVSFAGDYMYVCSLTDVYQYSLAQAYNPSNALYIGGTYDLTADTSSDILHECIRVNAAGTRMYSLGATNDNIYQWTLATPYTVSTASYDGALSLSSQDSTPLKFDVSQDGTKLFVFGGTNNEIYRYSMTAWDITSASFDTGQELSLSATDVECRGVSISDDGSNIFTVGNTATEHVYNYGLSTPYDLTTPVLTTLKFDVSGFTDSPQDVSFSPSGRRMYLIEDVNDVVAMYYTGNVVAPEDS